MRLYPLNATQEDMLQEADLATLTTSYSVTAYIEIPNKVLSFQELATASQAVLDKIPYLHSHLVRVNGEVMICEDPDMPCNIICHEMSDEDWKRNRSKIPRPFKMLEEPCLHYHVIKTETKSVFSIEYNHLFFDGFSMKNILNELEKELNGQPLIDQGDITAVWNEEERASYGSDNYLIAKAATLEKFSGLKYTDICRRTDNPVGKVLYSCYLLDYNRIKHIRLNSGVLTEDQQNKMMNTICVSAYALALGQMAGTDDVMFMTTNHGRIDKRLRGDILGNFLKSMSLRINIEPEQSVAALIAQTRTALFGMMRTIIYPWTHSMRDLGIPPEEQVGTEMNVSGTGIYEYITIKGSDYPSYHIEMPQSDIHLFLVVQIREEGLTFNVEGSSALYAQEQLDTIAQLTGEYTLYLIADQGMKIRDVQNKVNQKLGLSL